MSDWIAVASLALNVVLVWCTVIAGRAAWLHFRGGAVLAWLAQFNTKEFLEADEIVCSLVDDQDPSTLVERINAKPEHRVAVTYVLSFVSQAAQAARVGLMHKKTLMRYTVFIIPYYYHSLLPWIEARRAYRGEPDLYADIDWLVNEIQASRKR